MKLVIAIIQAKDADACAGALTSAGFVCTRFNSFGGFLDRANVTLMIGVDDPLVEGVLDVLRRTGRLRSEALDAASSANAVNGSGGQGAVDVEVGGATVFVVDIERFERI